MAPDLPPADAAASKATDDNMQGDAVQIDAPTAVRVPRGKSNATASGETRGSQEITRRDVHTASSISAQRRFPTSAVKEPNLAHQAALRSSSVKGKDIAHDPLVKSSTTTSNSGPVLVRKPSVKADMSKKSKPGIKSDSPRMPPLESFSFQDILASIGPESNASIDAIAEICGRSKMSLAEEHGSHRPPQAQLGTLESSPAESVPSMRLETVEETPQRPHTRSQSRSLALASGGDGILADATAATSNITSHAQSNISNTSRSAQNTSESPSSPLLSQIFAWLRGSHEAANTSERGPRAARTLQTVLSDTDSIRS